MVFVVVIIAVAIIMIVSIMFSLSKECLLVARSWYGDHQATVHFMNMDLGFLLSLVLVSVE